MPTDGPYANAFYESVRNASCMNTIPITGFGISHVATGTTMTFATEIGGQEKSTATRREFVLVGVRLGLEL